MTDVKFKGYIHNCSDENIPPFVFAVSGFSLYRSELCFSDFKQMSVLICKDLMSVL